MTLSMLSPLTRRSLAALPKPAQREFESWLRNKLQILTGSNDLEAIDDRLPHLVRGLARQRNRAAQLTLEELGEIFGEKRNPNPDDHLGATECERTGAGE
jgi:hypothetical protein